MTDRFLKSFPTDVEREKRVGGFFEDILFPALKDLGTDTIDLEIGCGHGHWLTEYSMAFEQTLFVGIDLITKRVEKATAKMKKRGLQEATAGLRGASREPLARRGDPSFLVVCFPPGSGRPAATPIQWTFRPWHFKA